MAWRAPAEGTVRRVAWRGITSLTPWVHQRSQESSANVNGSAV